jgi:acyl-CoA reductase-like NAD-dependent aldehyde dehydrogenase
VTSWKNPLLNSMLYIVPSFLNGNISVLKPSSEAPTIGLELEQIFDEQAFEKSLVSLVLRTHELPELLENIQI